MLSHHSGTSQRRGEPNLILLPSSMGMLVGSPVGLLSTEWAGLVGRILHKDAWPAPLRRGPRLPDSPGTYARSHRTHALASPQHCTWRVGTSPASFLTRRHLSLLSFPKPRDIRGRCSPRVPARSRGDAASLALPEKPLRRFILKHHPAPSPPGSKKSHLPAALSLCSPSE